MKNKTVGGMNKVYQNTTQFLYNLQKAGIKLGLENIRKLLHFWGNPQEKWASFHIAGTNGKGSTAAFLATILQEAGYRVGLYTSPHLVDFNERIRVNGIPIPHHRIITLVEAMRSIIEEIHPTFFEATTALAFRYFAEEAVEVAVIETGLGGRLDATNLVQPVMSIITPISLEHQQYLGTTLPQIAREKAGIIKKGVPCLTNNRDKSVLSVLRNRAEELESPFYCLKAEEVEILELNLQGSRFTLHSEDETLARLEIPLAGAHQVHNAALAVKALKQQHHFAISEADIRQGLRKTRWRARLEIIRKEPLVLLDVSHNPQGFEQTFSFLRKQFPRKKIHVILGLSHDKDFQKIADIIEQFVTDVNLVDHFSERGLNSEILFRTLTERRIPVRRFSDIQQAFSQEIARIDREDLLLIVGSHYLAGEFIQKIQNS